MLRLGFGVRPHVQASSSPRTPLRPLGTYLSRWPTVTALGLALSWEAPPDIRQRTAAARAAATAFATRTGHLNPLPGNPLMTAAAGPQLQAPTFLFQQRTSGGTVSQPSPQRVLPKSSPGTAFAGLNTFSRGLPPLIARHPGQCIGSLTRDRRWTRFDLPSSRPDPSLRTRADTFSGQFSLQISCLNIHGRCCRESVSTSSPPTEGAGRDVAPRHGANETQSKGMHKSPVPV
jgi:hypothetical protein